MENIPPNKERFLSRNAVPYNVNKGKDVFDAKTIKTWDILNSGKTDKKTSSLPNIFPSLDQNNDDN